MVVPLPCIFTIPAPPLLAPLKDGFGWRGALHSALLIPSFYLSKPMFEVDWRKGSGKAIAADLEVAHFEVRW